MRVLGKTGIKVNEIGLGGIPIQRITEENVRNMILAMLEEGMNFIDTARGYTNSEELLGTALEGVRENFVVATKSMARTYEGMRADIEISLKNLRTDYIDLYQLHNVQISEDIDEAIKALEDAKNQGKIKIYSLLKQSILIKERENI